jgi:LmbE family N-acetylglucosaminyl deacetylase
MNYRASLALMSFRHLIALARHPRMFMNSILTYPRFLGAIKPDLLKGNGIELEARLACLRSSLSPAKLSFPVGHRILAISPHPDDETIGAGGLLLAHSGYAEISIITIFNGDGGGLLEGAEQEAPNYKSRLVEARLKELHAACAHFSGKVIGSLGLSDGYVPVPADNAVNRLRDLVKSVRPDVVIIPWLLDNHADHRTANFLWARACADVSCMVLGTEIWSLGSPNAYFDITDLLSDKLVAISEYKTQLATVDYASLVDGLAKTRGFQSGLRARRAGAAEGYFVLPNKEYCELVRAFGASDALEN